MEPDQITMSDHASTQCFIQRTTQRIERKQIYQGIQYTSLKVKTNIGPLKKSCEARIQDNLSLLKQTFPSV